MTTALAALAAAAIAPPDGVALPATLEPALREACAGAWRAVEVVLAGDVLRGRLGKTRDTIVRDAVESVLALHGNVGIRADALASLRAARDAGALDGPLDLAAVIADTRQGAPSTAGRPPTVAGRVAVSAIRKSVTSYRELDLALGDADLASLLVDAARAIFRSLARDPELARWAIGPTGSPGRDRALAAFAELAASPDSIAELETLIAMPIHLDDNVQFTVYRPRAIDPGKWHQLLAFAHLADRRPGEDDLPDPVEEVQRQAAAVLGDKAKQYQPVVQDSGAAIPAEGELTFVPEFPGIEVNPPRRSFLWLESVHREEFRIRAGRELDGKTVRGRVTVFLGHIAIAEVACMVKVDAARPEPTKREPTSVRAYRKIFASYSHRDLEIVNQFETYARALGDEYLRDWVHLRTGEVWTDRLCQLIASADAFQLFWSRNSMSSQFVRQEYEYALSLNRASFVRPTYWEDPMPTAPGLPPEALLRLHFQKLGAAQIGAAGRNDTNVNLVARKKRAESKLDKMEVERERADTKPKLDKMEVERERGDRKQLDTMEPERERGIDQYAQPEADFDVTDPQYSLPDMPAAEASSSMPAAAPPPDLRRRMAQSPPARPAASRPPPPLDDEDLEDSPVALREEASFSDVEPFETARMQSDLAAADHKRAFDPRAITTAPGVGPAQRPPALECPTCKHQNSPDVHFCSFCGTALGVSSAAAQPAKTMMAPDARPIVAPMTTAPGVVAPAAPAPGPAMPMQRARPASSAPTPSAPASPAPMPMSQPAQPARPASPSSAPMPKPAPMIPSAPASPSVPMRPSAPASPSIPMPTSPPPSTARPASPSSAPTLPVPMIPSAPASPSIPMPTSQPSPSTARPASPSSAPTLPVPMIPSAPASPSAPAQRPPAEPMPIAATAYPSAPASPSAPMQMSQAQRPPAESMAAYPGPSVSPMSQAQRPAESMAASYPAPPPMQPSVEPIAPAEPAYPATISEPMAGYAQQPPHAYPGLSGSPASMPTSLGVGAPTPGPSPFGRPSPGIIPTTSPGIGPASRPSAPPPAPTAAPDPSEESPWQRPEAKEAAPAASIVSPFAPTVPQEVYKPVPGDPMYQIYPGQLNSVGPTPEKGSPGWRPGPPESARRSILPLVLVTIGIVALLVVILIWLLA